jgi:hypothetical protein
MLDFIFGLLLGVLGMVLLAIRIANRANKPAEAKPSNEIAATSVSMDRKSGIAALDPWHQRLMTDIIARIEGEA